MPADCAFYGYPTCVLDPRREGTEGLEIVELGSGPVDVRKNPACSAQVEEYIERDYNRDLAERRTLLIEPADPRTDDRDDLSAIYCGKRCVVIDKHVVVRDRPEVRQFGELLLDGPTNK